MNAPTSLEERIRRGLRDAAAAVPPADPQARDPRLQVRPAAASRRWTFRLAAGVAAVAAVTAAVVFVTGDDEERPRDVEAGTPDEATAPEQPPPVEHPVPGQAVAVGTELRTYDAAGTQTGAVSLAPFIHLQSISSDLTGGWLVCGSVQPTSTTTSIIPDGEVIRDENGVIVEDLSGRVVTPGTPDALMWFPAEGEPVELEGPGTCMADVIQVVDTPEGPTAIYQAMGTMDTGMFGLHAMVLATGESRQLTLPGGVDPNGFYRWSARANRVALHSDESGLIVFDWTTGQTVPTPAIDLGDPSDIALSNDGTSIAVVAGEVDGPSDLVVYDLATGAERFRETFPTLATEGAELSYDGTVVAVGNAYDEPEYPPVTVIDITTGARNTIDVRGHLP